MVRRLLESRRLESEASTTVGLQEKRGDLTVVHSALPQGKGVDCIGIQGNFQPTSNRMVDAYGRIGVGTGEAGGGEWLGDLSQRRQLQSAYR